MQDYLINAGLAAGDTLRIEMSDGRLWFVGLPLSFFSGENSKFARLSAGALKTLCAIRYYGTIYKEARPTKRQIAELAGLSADSIKQHLRQLEKLEMCFIARREQGGCPVASRYVVVDDEAENMPGLTTTDLKIQGQITVSNNVQVEIKSIPMVKTLLAWYKSGQFTACPPAAWKVVVALCRFVNWSDLSCFPKRSTLAELAGCHDVTIWRHFETLQKAGFFEITPRYIDGNQRSNLYSLGDCNLNPTPLQPTPQGGDLTAIGVGAELQRRWGSECNAINNGINTTEINQPNQQETGRLVDLFINRKRGDRRRLGLPRQRVISCIEKLLQRYYPQQIILAIEASDFYVVPEKLVVALENLPTREMLELKKEQSRKKQQDHRQIAEPDIAVKRYGILRAAFKQLKSGNEQSIYRQRFESRGIDISLYSDFDQIPTELLEQ